MAAGNCPRCEGEGCVYCKWTGGAKPPKPAPQGATK